MSQLKLLRIVFFGTTNFASQHLYTLIHSYVYQIVAIFTQSKKQQSRKYDESLFSIENIAKKYNLPLFQYSTLTFSEMIHIIKILNTDLIIVVSCGLILPKEILSIPKLGCINVHGSLLPRWRGPAPIQRALEYGDSVTGISIIKIDIGIDTGCILKTATCNILPQDTTNTLSEKLAHIGSTTLLYTLQEIISGTYTTTPQNPTYATYAYKITKKEARIDWTKSANQLERCIRAFNPWPICFFAIKNNLIRIWSSKVYNKNIKNVSSSKLEPGTILKTNQHGIYVATGHGILILTILQISGKKITPVQDILNAKKEWFVPYSVLE